jgi:flagellar hook-length control protein FliK
LYEKYIKYANKSEGEAAAKKEPEAPEAVIMQDKIALNDALRDALLKGDEAAVKEALLKGADLSEAIKYEPVSYNFLAKHAPVHAMDQTAISQELEQDDSLASLFLILKKANSGGILTKAEKAEIASLAKLPAKETVEKEENFEEELEVAPKKPQKPQTGLKPKQQPPTQLHQKHIEPKQQPEIERSQSIQVPQKQQRRAEPAVLPIALSQPIAQPEVRAIWEGSDLKIEAFNPKTGEKLQTVNTRTPHAMQERIHEFEVVKQVIAKAKLITTPVGDQRMTLQLRPDHLGQVDMRITLSSNEMQIQARVESPVAQAALETHIGLLREGLEKQGITLDRLEVSVEQKDKQDAFSLAERQDREEQREHQRNKSRRAREQHLAVSISQKDPAGDTGRRLGYNSMEYLA